MLQRRKPNTIDCEARPILIRVVCRCCSSLPDLACDGVSLYNRRPPCFGHEVFQQPVWWNAHVHHLTWALGAPARHTAEGRGRCTVTPPTRLTPNHTTSIGMRAGRTALDKCGRAMCSRVLLRGMTCVLPWPLDGPYIVLEWCCWPYGLLDIRSVPPPSVDARAPTCHHICLHSAANSCYCTLAGHRFCLEATEPRATTLRLRCSPREEPTSWPLPMRSLHGANTSSGSGQNIGSAFPSVCLLAEGWSRSHKSCGLLHHRCLVVGFDPTCLRHATSAACAHQHSATQPCVAYANKGASVAIQTGRCELFGASSGLPATMGWHIVVYG